MDSNEDIFMKIVGFDLDYKTHIWFNCFILIYLDFQIYS